MKKQHLLWIHVRVVSEFLIQQFCLLYFIIFKGNAMLMVGVFGPKYPCEEVFIKHVGNNQYNVQYVKISD